MPNKVRAVGGEFRHRSALLSFTFFLFNLPIGKNTFIQVSIFVLSFKVGQGFVFYRVELRGRNNFLLKAGDLSIGLFVLAGKLLLRVLYKC